MACYKNYNKIKLGRLRVLKTKLGGNALERVGPGRAWSLTVPNNTVRVLKLHRTNVSDPSPLWTVPPPPSIP